MKKLFFLLTTLVAYVCASGQDIIVTKDGKKIEAKITEVSKFEIKYKEFDYQDGPIFILDTSEIATVTYGNGKIVVYNQLQSAEDLALERAKVEGRTSQQVEAEAVSVAKANQFGSLFGQSEKTSDASHRGNPIVRRSDSGNSWTLSGRSLRGAFPMPSSDFKQEGKVVVQIRVNTAGDVVEAKCSEGTSITDRQTQQLALDAAKKAKFSKGDFDVIGTITYIFKLN